MFFTALIKRNADSNLIIKSDKWANYVKRLIFFSSQGRLRNDKIILCGLQLFPINLREVPPEHHPSRPEKFFDFVFDQAIR